MKLIDMDDYPPVARAVWVTQTILGYVALAYALWEVAALPLGTQARIAVAAAIAMFVGFFPVQIPARGVKLSVEGGDIFVYLALLLYGPAAATVAAAGEACIGSLRGSKRATSRIGSPALSALSMLLAGSWFVQVHGAFEQPPDAVRTLVVLFGAAFSYASLNLVLARAIFALKQREPVHPIAWLREYLWFATYSTGSASLAGVLYMSERHLGFEAILVAAPLVAMFMSALHFHFEKKKADDRHLAELTASERRLQEALKSAEQASRAKTQFLAAASHDLRQPLHALSFLTAALDMRPLDAPARDILHRMADALEDLSLEFDMLLDMSKLDAGLVPISAAAFEVLPFLERIAQPFVPGAQARALGFEVCGDRGIYVNTDRALLERVVRNLLDNAFKYTPQGSVRVTCGVHDGRCRIDVADTGIGIPEHEQEHVFEEFYQLGNPERDRRKGLGLGLSIVRRLANLLGLQLAMDSRLAHGTTFSLELEAVSAPERAEIRAPRVSTELRERQVLLLDDEAAPRDALRAYLESLGCRVSVAGTMAEAAALAMLEEPDIVLADFRLRRGETGLEVIRRLRESRPGLPAIIVTGDTAPERLAQFEGTGIEVLHKPVVPTRLVESMVALLAANASTEALPVEEAALS
jgi:signal transduction histidine kinase/AmiR/NasT family two-component response regulator